MALSPFRLPRLLSGVRLVDDQGRATIDFQRWWQEVVEKIEAQESSQDQLIADIQALQQTQSDQLELILATQATAVAAQQTANDALTQADSGPSATARSGSVVITNQAISGTSWVMGPTIALTTVSAGDLTITGTGPTGGSLTAGNTVAGEFRVVELVGSTTLFTGTFLITESGVTNYSAADVAAFVLAEVTTGSVSYRLDVRRSGGSPGSTGTISMYGFARRS